MWRSRRTRQCTKSRTARLQARAGVGVGVGRGRPLGRGAARRTCAEALGAARACAEADAAGAADDDNAGQLAPGPAAEGGDGVVLDDDGGLGQNLEPLLGLHGLGVSVQKDGI